MKNFGVMKLSAGELIGVVTVSAGEKGWFSDSVNG